MRKSESVLPALCESGTGQNPKYSVLLVEDEQVDRIAFRKFVRDAGLSYDYAIVDSVSEAKDVLCRSAPFDIVVCDYWLGDGTAFDILELVKDAPVILVTGAGDEETAVRAWKAGICDYLIKDARGDYLHTLAVTIENAVEHRRTKMQLDLLSGAIMHASDCIYITDLQGQIVFVNSAFCRTYGYQREQILGRDSSILWTGEHPYVPAGCVLGIRTAGGGTAVGFYHQRRDGRIFPVSLSRSIIKDSHAHDVAVVGIARDLSEHLLLVDEFHAEVKSLVAHDKRYKDLTITVVEALNALLERGDVYGALRIVGGFREALGLETDELRLQRAEVDVGLLIERVVEALRPAAAEKNIELFAPASETELVVQADWDHTVRAVTSILRSLIYAVPGKGRLTVRVQEVDNGVTVEMESNDAVGAVRRIHQTMDGFDSFGGHSAPHGDMVLSLVVARRLIELQGGTTGTRRGNEQSDIFFVILPKVPTTQKGPVAANYQGAPA